MDTARGDEHGYAVVSWTRRNQLAQRHSTELAAITRTAVDAVLDQERRASSLFDALREGTTKGNGIFRDAYGDGENCRIV